jgi:hypothetical protein
VPFYLRSRPGPFLLAHCEDILATLLELETPGIYFLHGAPDLSLTAVAAQANPDQLGEFRALGYID